MVHLFHDYVQVCVCVRERAPTEVVHERSRPVVT